MDALVLPGSAVIDIGCGDKKFSNRLGHAKVTTVDAFEGARPDVLMDISNRPLPFEDNSFDVVLFTDIIEHMDREGGLYALKEAMRVCSGSLILYTLLSFNHNEELPGESRKAYVNNKYNRHSSVWSGDDFPYDAGWRRVTHATEYLGVWSKRPMPVGYSIIMPYHHRPDQLYNTLLSYRHWYSNRSNYEVVIIEDPVSEANVEWHIQLVQVLGAFPEMKLRIVHPPRRGISTAHNFGVDQAQFPFVIFSGPEILHYRNVLDMYDVFMAQRPDDYAVGSCWLSTFPGRQEKLSLDSFGIKQWYQHRNVLDRQLHFNACMSKSTYRRVGGFSVKFDEGVGFEDNDFIEVVRDRGVRAYSYDLVETVHQEHPVVAKNFQSDLHTRNEQLLGRRRNCRARQKVRPESIPVVINNRNLLTWPKAMVADLRRMGIESIVIVDNSSTYEPLLDWYATSGLEVVRLTENLGHHAPWDSGEVTRMQSKSPSGRYIVTDPDLDLSGVPSDCIEKLLECHRVYGDDIHKVGLSLELSDLPDNAYARGVRNWESQYWEAPKGVISYMDTELPHKAYMAAIDTTFAMYRSGSMIVPFPRGQIRLDRPYTARHVPWYLTKETIDDEYRYYIERAGSCASWAQALKTML
jgi:hypothetical protein